MSLKESLGILPHSFPSYLKKTHASKDILFQASWVLWIEQI